MGKRILLDVNHHTGIRHYVDADEDGFTYQEHAPTQVENVILDECEKLRSLHQVKGRAFQLAAKVPLLTHTMWKKEWREKYKDTWTWQTFLSMKLNSRDNEKLRVGATDTHRAKKL